MSNKKLHKPVALLGVAVVLAPIGVELGQSVSAATDNGLNVINSAVDTTGTALKQKQAVKKDFSSDINVAHDIDTRVDKDGSTINTAVDNTEEALGSKDKVSTFNVVPKNTTTKNDTKEDSDKEDSEKTKDGLPTKLVINDYDDEETVASKKEYNTTGKLIDKTTGEDVTKKGVEWLLAGDSPYKIGELGVGGDNNGMAGWTREQYQLANPGYVPGTATQIGDIEMINLPPINPRLRSTLTIHDDGALAIHSTWSPNYGYNKVYRFKVDGATSFCIQHGTPAGRIETGAMSENIGSGFSGINAKQLKDAQDFIHFGYDYVVGHKGPTDHLEAWYGMTQLAVWTIMGQGKLTGVSGSFPGGTFNWNSYQSVLKSTYARMNAYKKKPTYADKTYPLKNGETLDLKYGIPAVDVWGMKTSDKPVWVDPKYTIVDTSGLKDAKATIDPKTGNVKIVATGPNPSGSIKFNRNGGSPSGGAKLFSSAGVQAQIVVSAPGKDSFVVNINGKDVPVKPEEPEELLHIKINKTNSSNAPVHGAKFAIINDKGETVQTLTTDDEGKATSRVLPKGTYKVIETGAPAPYLKDPKPQNVELVDQDEEVDFVDEEVLGRITVNKLDSETDDKEQGDAELDGAEFELIENESGEVVQTGKVQGHKIVWDDLPLGNYTIKETKPGKGYHLSIRSQTVTLSYLDDTTPKVESSVNFHNDVDKGKLELIKYLDKLGDLPTNTENEIEKIKAKFVTPETDDTTGNGVKGAYEQSLLPGIKFHVKLKSGKKIYYGPTEGGAGKDGEWLDEVVLTTGKPNAKFVGEKTTSEGNIVSDWLPYGLYEVTEEIPKEYVDILKQYPQFKPQEEALGKETDDNKDLFFNQKFEVKIGRENATVNDKTHTYTVHNKAVTKPTEILKVDKDTGKPVLTKDAKFKIKNLATGEYYSEKGNDVFTINANGAIRLSRKLADNSTRDKDGNITSRPGYQLEEVQAPIGYKLDPTPIKFVVVDGNVDKQSSTIDKGAEGKNDAGAVISPDAIKITKNDAPQLGRIKINKNGEVIESTEDAVDEKTGVKYKKFKVVNRPLAGVTFDLYAAEDINFSTFNFKRDQVVQGNLKTDKNGNLKTKRLPAGKYYFKEVSAPNGYYVPTGKKFETEIKYDSELASNNMDAQDVTVNIENDLQGLEVNVPKTGDVVDQYVNQDYGFTTKTEKLKGATFGIYTDEDIKGIDGNVIAPIDTLVGVATSAEEGIAKFQEKYPQGKFYVKEIKTPGDKYKLNTGKFGFEFKVNNDEQTKKLWVYSDGSLHAVQDKPDEQRVPIDNKLETNRFQLKKLTEILKPESGSGKADKATYEISANAKGKGAQFTLRDDLNRVAQIMTVGADSTITSNELPLGEYTLKETKAPSGEYRINNTVYKVKLEKDKVTITDDKGKALKGTPVQVKKAVNPDDVKAQVDAQNSEGKNYEDSLLVTNPVIGDNVIVTPGTDTMIKATDVITNWQRTFGITSADEVETVVTTKAEGPAEMWDKLEALGAKRIDRNTDFNVPGHYVALVKTKKGEFFPIEVWVKQPLKGSSTEQVGQFSITNYLKKGELDFTKDDVSTGKPLPGAKINIHGNGIDINYITSSHGNDRFKLPEGTYTFTEIAPPDGYEVTPEVGTFTIKDGKVTKARLHDRRRILPKTGNSLMFQAGTALLITITGLTGLWVVNRKKRA